MKNANRSVAIVRPKRNFTKWANANSIDGREFSAEYFAKNQSFAVTMPYYDFIVRESAKRYINFVCEEIFSYALERWNPNTDTWPEDLGKDMFAKWFTVEYVYNVIE
ncbi:MAG: hypothetical protein BGO69_10990 [Bacteroidetes bacterium 46-16]|nr:MAG: hypothetical protein BGO69_10990 [Bacteroidetes bacterium 46-16]